MSNWFGELLKEKVDEVEAKRLPPFKGKTSKIFVVGIWSGHMDHTASLLLRQCSFADIQDYRDHQGSGENLGNGFGYDYIAGFKGTPHPELAYQDEEIVRYISRDEFDPEEAADTLSRVTFYKVGSAAELTQEYLLRLRMNNFDLDDNLELPEEYKNRLGEFATLLRSTLEEVIKEAGPDVDMVINLCNCYCDSYAQLYNIIIADRVTLEQVILTDNNRLPKKDMEHKKIFELECTCEEK